VVDAGAYVISATLVVARAIRIAAVASAANGTNGTFPQTPPTTSLVWKASVAGAIMMQWIAPVSGQVIARGEISGGLVFDGNNVATVCLRLSSVAMSSFDVATYRSTQNGCIIDDGNNALTNAVYFRRFEHFCGSNASAHSSNGMLIDGDTTGKFCTNILCDFFEAEVVNGHGLTLRSVDSCDFRRIKCYDRSGAGGTGLHLRFLKSVNYTTFHAQKNRIGMMIAGGSIYFGDFTKNNVIDCCVSEYGSVVYESAGADKRTNHISRLIDFRNGGSWQTSQFKLNDYSTLPLGAFAGFGTPATATTVGGTGAGTAWSFPAAGTTGVSFSDMMPGEWNDGFIIGARLLLQSVGSTTGDAVFKVQSLAVPKTSAVGSLTRSVTATLTPAQSAGSTLTLHDLTFPTEEDAFHEGLFCVTVERLGSDASDTYVNALVLAGVQLIYRAKGPDSGASYGPYQRFLVGGQDANP
jgi:hypothetical protein